jgi:hypothetical protein
MKVICFDIEPKLVVEENTDRVLGVHMVGDHAAEIVQSLAVSLRMGITKQAMEQAIGIHPSSAEEFFSLERSPNYLIFLLRKSQLRCSNNPSSG